MIASDYTAHALYLFVLTQDVIRKVCNFSELCSSARQGVAFAAGQRVIVMN